MYNMWKRKLTKFASPATSIKMGQRGRSVPLKFRTISTLENATQVTQYIGKTR